MAIEDKFEQLRNLLTDEDSQRSVAKFRDEWKKAYLLTSLSNHAGIRLLILKFERDISLIKRELDDPKLFESDGGMLKGQVLHARRKWCEDFLEFFAIEKRKVGNIIKHIDSEINYQKNNE